MNSRPPQKSFLSQIPTPVLVAVWLCGLAIVAGCLIVVLLAPNISQTASVSPTDTARPTTRASRTPTAKAIQPVANTPMPAGPAAVATQPAAKGPATPTRLPMDEVFGYGVQVNGLNDYDASERSINAASQLKMTWIKQQVKWGLVDVNPTQMDYLDRLVRKANKAGIKVMLSIVTSPPSTHPGIGSDPNEDPDGVKAPPDNPQDYANFVGNLIDHFKSTGYSIHAIEVWNEQNLSREWRTKPQKIDAGRYMQMLSLTYKAVKSRDPNIIVISGAPSPTGVHNGVDSVDDFEYIKQMVGLGLLNNVDCVGVHHNGYNLGPDVTYDTTKSQPYASTAFFRGPFDNPHHSWSFKTTLQKSSEAVSGKKPLCVTEFGWASSVGIKTPVRQGFEFAQDNSLENQAAYITQAYSLMRQWGFVKLAFLWNLNFNTVTDDPSTTDNAIYSLLTPDGMPRPAFEAVEKMPKP